MNFSESLHFLDRFINREAIAGRIHGLSLEAMGSLVGCMGDPQRDLKAIHVTGTNGKGSVVAMTHSILSASGLRVGSYMSPHVDTIRERFVLMDSKVSEEAFADLISEVEQFVETYALEPSYFELLTAAAFLLFNNEAVDAAIVEVGILGRFDATNVIEAEVAVITNIGLDHTEGGEGWRREVASEKAGIIVEGKPLVLGEVQKDVRDLFEAENPETLLIAGEDFFLERSVQAVGGQAINIKGPFSEHEEIFLPLYGKAQARNAAIALAAAEAFLDSPVSSEALSEGLAGVSIPGRLEVLSRRPVVLVDGAHNQDSASHLADTINEVFPSGRRILILGILEPHSPQEIINELIRASPDFVITCTAPSPRGISATDLASAVSQFGLEVEAVDDVKEATRRAVAVSDEEDLIFAAGSFYIISDVRSSIQELFHSAMESNLLDTGEAIEF